MEKKPLNQQITQEEFDKCLNKFCLNLLKKTTEEFNNEIAGWFKNRESQENFEMRKKITSEQLNI